MVKRIAVCLNVLAEEKTVKFTVSPTPLINSTHNEEPFDSSTPRSHSNAVRRTGQESDTSINSLSSLNLERHAMPLDTIKKELENYIAALPNHQSANAVSNPYRIMEDLRGLAERYESFNQASDELIDKLYEVEEVQAKVICKGEHFESLVEDLMKAVEERIWDLCKMQQSPLPITCSTELKNRGEYT